VPITLRLKTFVQSEVDAMKIPLDQVCVRSGTLCDRCQRMIDEGVVEEFEMKLMSNLLDIEDKEIKELKDSTYHKAFRADKLVILVVTSGAGMTPTKWIRVARILQDRIRAKVRVMEKTTNIKVGASQLLSPARVLGVNTVWLPDGTVQHVVRISRSEKRLLPVSEEELEKILSKLYSTQIRIRVE